jgi:hypothetical protein
VKPLGRKKDGHGLRPAEKVALKHCAIQACLLRAWIKNSKQKLGFAGKRVYLLQKQINCG